MIYDPQIFIDTGQKIIRKALEKGNLPTGNYRMARTRGVVQQVENGLYYNINSFLVSQPDVDSGVVKFMWSGYDQVKDLTIYHQQPLDSSQVPPPEASKYDPDYHTPAGAGSTDFWPRYKGVIIPAVALIVLLIIASRLGWLKS